MSDGWIVRNENGIRFDIRLTPNAGANELGGLAQDADGRTHLKVRVTAIPENNKANKALVALIAKSMRTPKGQIEIVSGHTSRLKSIAISGDAAELSGQLMALARD